MRSTKFTAKRALGLTLATALAVTGTVAVATSSQAASIQALKLSPATGSSLGGTIVTITGKDFQSAAGTSKIAAVYFSTSTCAVANKTTNPAAVISVVSATKVNVTTPVLALVSSKATAYNLCVDDVGDVNVIGSGKFTSYAPPVINTSLGGTNGLSTSSGAVYGGDSITVTGENFTTKTTATIGGEKLTGVKVVIGSGTVATGNAGDDTLTGLVPAGAAGTAAVVITNEGGSATSGGAGVKAFTYLDALKVAPAYGNGTLSNVISVTGVGFSGRTFSATAAASASMIQVAKAGTNTTIVGPVTEATWALTTPVLCTAIQVVSDTELSCKLPALTGAANAGPYTVQIVDSGATNLSGVTAVSRGATYTVSAF
jgi:hypothetical protein